MMIVQFLPIALVGPVAGVVVDRVDRRRLMIAADIVRGVLILGLLLVRRPDQVWIAYVVMALTVSATAFFEPARTATIPNITSDRGADAGQRAVERDVVGHARARRVDRRPGHVRWPAATSRSSSTRSRFSRRPYFIAADALRLRAAPRGAADEGWFALTGHPRSARGPALRARSTRTSRR